MQNNKSNLLEYKMTIYDKYDIIDFLEPIYMDYLETIPNEIWNKYVHDISIRIGNINDINLFRLINSKVKIDYIDLLFKKNTPIEFELLKIIIAEPELLNKIILKFKNHTTQLSYTYKTCILTKNLEFNICFYEQLYLKYANLYDKKKNFKPTDYFLKITDSIFSGCESLPKYYDVFKYYVNKSKLIDSIAKKKLDNLCCNVMDKYKFKNYDEFENIIQTLGLIKSKIILILYSKVSHYSKSEIILNILECGDIDYFSKVITKYPIPLSLINKNIVINMLATAGLTSNFDLFLIILNLFSNCIKMNHEIYSRVLEIIVRTNRRECSEIIYKLLSVGATISGYSEYTDFIKSIKIKS